MLIDPAREIEGLYKLTAVKVEMLKTLKQQVLFPTSLEQFDKAARKTVANLNFIT